MKNPSTPIIFIIDENRFYAKLIQQYLNVADYYEILLFNNPEACIEYLDINPDIIIAEYQYISSQRQGLKLLKTVKTNNPETRLIFLTADKDVETAIKAIRAGATDYIIKSKYAPFKLIHKVNNIVKLKKDLLRNNSIRRKLIASVSILLLLTGFLIYFYNH